MTDNFQGHSKWQKEKKNLFRLFFAGPLFQVSIFSLHQQPKFLWLYLIIADPIPAASLIRQRLQILDPKLPNKPEASDVCCLRTHKTKQTITDCVQMKLFRTFTSIPFSKRLSGSDFISQWQCCGDSELSLFPPVSAEAPAFFLPPALVFTGDAVSPPSPFSVLLCQQWSLMVT